MSYDDEKTVPGVVITPDAWYDTDAVEKLLGVKRGTIITAAKAGTLAYSQVGHVKLYRGSDITAWILSCRPRPKTKA